jgi:hypothetical protein
VKIDTTKPRLPTDRPERFKHPLKPVVKKPCEPDDLSLGGKDGEELESVVRKLYNSKIRNEIDSWLEMRKK